MKNQKLFVCLLATCAAFVACASSSATSPSGVTSMAVTLTEFKVDVPSSLPHGQHTLTITNNGRMQHELLVFRSDLDPAQYPLDGTGSIQEDGPGITKISDGDNIDPGKSQARTLDLTQAGRYLFVCNLPGHFKQGMYTVVTVN